jgi:NhaP-type Na+/H+ or K+/H+ antiporter
MGSLTPNETSYLPIPPAEDVSGDPADDDSGFKFGLLALLLGMCVRSFLRLIPPGYYRPPYTVMMFLVGVGLEVVELAEIAGSLQSWKDLHPNFILFVLVPPLLFESSFNVEWHVFMRVLPSSMLLAGPAVLLSCSVVGLVVTPVVNIWIPSFSFPAGFLVGSIVCATDPVAVTALLKELGAPGRLGMLVEGEALLNDASAVMLFLVFAEILRDESLELTALSLTGRLLYLGLGAVAWGLFMGFITYQWLKAFRDVTIDITCLVVGVFIVFYVGEHLIHVSGILSVVIYGLFLARNKTFAMKHEELEENHGFWEEAAFLSNTFIFIISGVLVADRVRHNDTFVGHASGATVMTFVWMSVALYLFLLVVRGVVISLFFVLLSNMGYGFTWKEAAMLTFSGLRGAIALSLALIVEQDDRVGDTVCHPNALSVDEYGLLNCIEAKELRDVVLILVCGVTTLSLVINGSLAGWFYRVLKVYSSNAANAHIEHLALDKLSAEFRAECDEFLRAHWLHSKADAEVFSNLICDVDKIILGKDGHAKINFDECWTSLPDAWSSHMERYGAMSCDQIRDFLFSERTAAEMSSVDAGQQLEKSPRKAPLFEEERVARPELKKLGIRFASEVGAGQLDQLSSIDRQMTVHRMSENVTSVYAVLIKAVDNALHTEQHKHLISHRCLGSLEFSIGVAKDVLARKDLSDPANCPLLEFFDSVHLEIESGMVSFQGSLMSHQMLDHLMLSTEMLYGVIMIFKDLREVGGHIELPGWENNASRFSANIEAVMSGAHEALNELYHEHPRLMVTVHTILATRHGYHILGHRIHTYGESGLLSEEFDQQTKEAFTIRLREIHDYFDTSWVRRFWYSLCYRGYGVVPIVDSSLYRDERAAGLSCSAFCQFLNPFTSSHSLERRRHKQALKRLKLQEEAERQATEDSLPRILRLNPLGDDRDESGGGGPQQAKASESFEEEGALESVESFESEGGSADDEENSAE